MPARRFGSTVTFRLDVPDGSPRWVLLTVPALVVWFVLGIEVDGARKAYPFSALDKALGERTQTLEDRLGGRRISIRFDREHRTAQAFDGSGREIPTVVGY